MSSGNKTYMRGGMVGEVGSNYGSHLIPAAKWFTKLVYIPWELKDEAQAMAKELDMSERAVFTEALIAGLKWVAWNYGATTDKLKGTDMELVHEAVVGVFRDKERKKGWQLDTLAAQMNRYARDIEDAD
jgi:ribonuclease HI